MACTGLTISAPSITCLDFLVSWDISGAQPIVTITNNSTVVTAANLKWWFYVTPPSLFPSIYGVDLNVTSPLPAPDFNGVAWTTKTINLTTPFGYSPCGQVEFSPNAPFSVTVFVQDSAATPPTSIFSYSKTAIIVRPAGNTQNSCGNFGVAQVNLQVNCQNKNSGIQLFDGTNLAYNNILAPASSSNKWSLVYPQDSSGNVITQEATNVASVSFPISINSDAYTVYFQQYATYNYGNGVTVKVQYKLFGSNNNLGKTFSINCNTNLCVLQCQMSKLRQLAKGTCGTVENANASQRLQQFTAIYVQILTGTFQPWCGGENVPALIKEAQKIGGFDDNCDCGCNDSENFGFSNPGNAPSGSGGCCPTVSYIIDNSTGNAPGACSSPPASYFPVQVMDPTHTTVIGSANNINDLIGIINNSAAWQVYGVAFAEGNCQVGWFSPSGVIPPSVYIVPGSTVIGPSAYVDALKIASGAPPPGCPAGNPYPVKVYDPTAAMVIGIANSIGDVVALLNSTPAWATYGVASVQDTCHVQFNLSNPSVIPPYVIVDPNVTGSGCTNNTSAFLINMIDPCYPANPITSSSFPCSLYFDWGLGAGSIPGGIVTSFVNIVSVLNNTIFSGKPPQLTFSLSTTPNAIQVDNSDCSAYPHTPTIYVNAGSNSFMLFGANFTDMIGTTPTLNGVEALGVADGSSLGRIPGTLGSKHMWHTIRVGNYAVVGEGDTGKIYFYNITNPLNPVLDRVIQLNDTGSGNCFTGLPHSINYQSPSVARASYFSLYFPTDLNASIDLAAIPVFEGTTGSVWIINFYTGTVLNSATQNALLGKCPRTCTGGSAGGLWTVYLTQDGNLEQAAGLSSGVTIGHVPTVIFGVTGGLSYGDLQVFTQAEYVWAASYDGFQYVYFTGAHGSVYAFAATGVGSSVSNFQAIGSSAQFLYRLNTACFGGKLYMAALDLEIGSPPSQYQPLKIITTASLLASSPVVSQIDVATSGEATINTFFNVMPLGGCLIAIVMAGGLAPGQPVVIYRTNGSLVGSVNADPDLTHGYYAYNYIAIPNINRYTPNPFIIP